MKKAITSILVASLLVNANSSLLITHAASSKSTDYLETSQKSADVKDQETLVESVEVLEDNEQHKVTSVTENGITTKSTYDKINKKLTIEIENEEPIVIDTNEATQTAKDGYAQKSNGLMAATTSNDMMVTRAATTVKENTFSNYEYTITFGSQEKWQIRRPKGESLVNYYYKNVTRTNGNKGNLNSFKNQVDIINDAELTMFGLLGSSVGFTVLGVILSVPTVGSGTLTSAMAAAGAYGSAITQGLKISRAAKNATIYYHRL